MIHLKEETINETIQTLHFLNKWLKNDAVFAHPKASVKVLSDKVNEHLVALIDEANESNKKKWIELP